MQSLTQDNFDPTLKASPHPVLVDFWAPWCGPCKALAPVLDTVAAQFEGKVGFAKVDVEEYTEARTRFNIKGLPTLVLFKHGEPVARLTGSRPAKQIALFIDEHLQAPAQPAAAPSRTFGGDAARKAACIARLRQHLAAGAVRRSSQTYWDGREGSPLGCATEAGVHEAPPTLGIPRPLLSLVEWLGSAHDSEQEAAEFVLRWLEALPVDRDARGVAADLAADLLSHPQAFDLRQADPEVQRLHAELVTLHRADADGQAVTADAWSRVHAALRAHAPDPKDRGPAAALARALAEAAAPLADDAAVINGLVNAAMQLAAARVRREQQWTQDDALALQKVQRQIIDTWPEFKGHAMRDKVEELAPELGRKLKAQHRAKQAAAEAAVAMLMQRTAACA